MSLISTFPGEKDLVLPVPRERMTSLNGNNKPESLDKWGVRETQWGQCASFDEAKCQLVWQEADESRKIEICANETQSKNQWTGKPTLQATREVLAQTCIQRMVSSKVYPFSWMNAAAFPSEFPWWPTEVGNQLNVKGWNLKITNKGSLCWSIKNVIYSCNHTPPCDYKSNFAYHTVSICVWQIRTLKHD